MKDHWKALNEKGVVVAYVGNKICHLPWNCLYLQLLYVYYISAQEDKEDYDNSDISLKFFDN